MLAVPTILGVVTAVFLLIRLVPGDVVTYMIGLEGSLPQGRVEDLKRLAMKQIHLEKAFNLRHTDFDRKDDLPTPRDMTEPIPGGKLAGWKIDEQKYGWMLDEYYDLHGWDRQTSFPKRETLIESGLADVAMDLEKIGKLR